jgi:hypothetical protein
MVQPKKIPRPTGGIPKGLTDCFGKLYAADFRECRSCGVRESCADAILRPDAYQVSETGEVTINVDEMRISLLAEREQLVKRLEEIDKCLPKLPSEPKVL